MLQTHKWLTDLRVKMLKDAKQHAEKEIEKFRENMEVEFEKDKIRVSQYSYRVEIRENRGYQLGGGRHKLRDYSADY